MRRHLSYANVMATVAVFVALGVRAVFTPKDFDLMDVIDRILDVIGAPAAERAA